MHGSNAPSTARSPNLLARDVHADVVRHLRRGGTTGRHGPFVFNGGPGRYLVAVLVPPAGHAVWWQKAAPAHVSGDDGEPRAQVAGLDSVISRDSRRLADRRSVRPLIVHAVVPWAVVREIESFDVPCCDVDDV